VIPFSNLFKVGNDKGHKIEDKGKGVSMDDHAIEIVGLTKKYGELIAVQNLDLTIEKGETFAFLGPNGAGKTTTINILMGFLFPTSGNAKIFGYDVIENGKEARAKIGFLPEELGFYDSLTAYEHMDFYSRLFGIPEPKRKEKILELLEMVGLSERKDSKLREYSHGMKQRLGIAQSLINDPELLIFDEPTSGLDPRASYEVRKIMEKLAEREVTIFLSSHLLHEVQQMCDTVGIIDRGILISKDKIKNLSKEIRKGIQIKITCLEMNDNIIDAVKGIKGVESVKVKGNDLIAMVSDEKVAADINSAIIESGGRVRKMEESTPDLEEIFLKLTKGDK
jgi:ABC-2 type transport system ATP-binding protein